MKTKEFLVIFAISLVITYFFAVHEYEHTVTLTQKYIEEPEYRLYRRKQADIVLTWEEYQSLRYTNPNDVYISDRLFFFVLEGELESVDEKTYNKYVEGSKIKYRKSFLFGDIDIK